MALMSKTLHRWSHDDVIIQLPLALNRMSDTVLRCRASVDRGCAVRGSHSTSARVASRPPDATRPLLGCHATDRTSAPWTPRPARSSRHVSKSKNLTVPSSDAVASLASVGEKHSRQMRSLCPSNWATWFMLDCQYMILPSSSHVAIQLWLCDQTMSRTPDWWACKIVSKLNVSPFHSVNSPVDAPVISLRPSGVHLRQKIGHLFLFTLWWKNRVVMHCASSSFLTCGGLSRGNAERWGCVHGTSR
mmetsp:Transcript_26849/g.70498  ORF Transcript_26849/g.70498 Transcript_26849/m.70498 type:complete len:246 (+) Transcript_26849:966-1703(+)